MAYLLRFFFAFIATLEGTTSERLTYYPEPDTIVTEIVLYRDAETEGDYDVVVWIDNEIPLECTGHIEAEDGRKMCESSGLMVTQNKYEIEVIADGPWELDFAEGKPMNVVALPFLSK